MRVYIETTIPSYLTSWPSPQVVHAGHQISTRDWWENHRHHYDLYRHIANAHVREDLRVLIASLGYILPTICSPEELLPAP